MKLSIITINLNNKSGLHDTIKSVIKQKYKSYEFIIVDGGSSDGSFELIKMYSNYITSYICEPDKGIYDAMNKGILRSKGEYLLMLNSGDVLCDEYVLDNVFSLNLKHDLIFGDVLWKENEIYYCSLFPEKLTMSYFFSNSIGHQACIIKKELHKKIGLYKTSFKICADWAFFMDSIIKYKCTYEKIKLTFTVCSRDGISTNPDNFPLIKYERNGYLLNKYSRYLKSDMLCNLYKEQNKYLKIANRKSYIKLANFQLCFLLLYFKKKLFKVILKH